MAYEAMFATLSFALIPTLYSPDDLMFQPMEGNKEWKQWYLERVAPTTSRPKKGGLLLLNSKLHVKLELLAP
jgi:hypothetical protein